MTKPTKITSIHHQSHKPMKITDLLSPANSAHPISSVHANVLKVFDQFEQQQHTPVSTPERPTSKQQPLTHSPNLSVSPQMKPLTTTDIKPSITPSTTPSPTPRKAISKTPQPSSIRSNTQQQTVAPTSNPSTPTTQSSSLPSLPYWRRLHQLLEEVVTTSTQLRPDVINNPTKEDKGAFGAVAIALQGLSGTAVDAERTRLSVNDESFSSACSQSSAGTIVEYGVSSAHAIWAAQQLASKIPTRETPPTDLNPKTILSVSETYPITCVELIRVRIYEAESAFLPTSAAADVVRARKVMRKLRQRVELCVKILCALEGRSRKFQPNLVEKWIASFEKNENQALGEKEKEKILNVAKDVHEKKIEDEKRVKKEKSQEKEALKGTKTEEQKKKLEMSEKKKRQQNAQASFMMRFVKSKDKSERIKEVRSEGPVDMAIPQQEDGVEGQSCVSFQKSDRSYAAPIANNLEVMDVSWWLRSQIEYISGKKETEQSITIQTTNEGTSVLFDHLEVCAKRRKAAEDVLPEVLQRFREHRKEHVGDRTPLFCKNRSVVRGRGNLGPVKLLQFDDNNRPAFFGTKELASTAIKPRKPLAKDDKLDYTCDSGEEWEEEEEGEDLCEMEAEKERDNEDAELRLLYGSDEDDDDDFLDDESLNGTEADEDMEDMDSPDDEGSTGEKNEVIEGSSRKEAVDVDSDDKQKSAGDKGNKRVRKYTDDSRRIKRRKGWPRNSVIIHGGMSVNDGDISMLDKHPVSMFENMDPIDMFNPYVFDSSILAAECLNGKPTKSNVRTGRQTMDESARRDLAKLLINGAPSREKLAVEFCEERKQKGLDSFSKAEVMRGISEIGICEKREGDSRATWYLSVKHEELLPTLMEMQHEPADEKVR